MSVTSAFTGRPVARGLRGFLEFDTTVTPVEYRGRIQAEGLDDAPTEKCPDLASNINYGGMVWMKGFEDDQAPVMERRLIVGRVEKGVSAFAIVEWTITQIK